MQRGAIGVGAALALVIGSVYWEEKRWGDKYEKQETLLVENAKRQLKVKEETFEKEKDVLVNEVQKYASKLHKTEEKLQVTAKYIERFRGGVLVPDEARHLIRYGMPSTENVHFHKGYVVSYDRRSRTASWSCEHLTSQTTENNVDRSRSHFKEDMDVPEIYRAKLSDYHNSGYDRGHLTPAGDVKFSQEAMNETFLLTNIAPQVGNGFNRHYWARLEKFSRDLLQHYEDVYICSGPLYLPELDETDGKYYVKYHVIGDPPNVSVPTHFFKTILVANPKSGTTESGGVDDPSIVRVSSFILPNRRIPSNIPLDQFMVTTEELNRASGLHFWNQATDPQSLCVSGRCQLPDPNWWKKGLEDSYPIQETLETFITSDDEEFVFPSTLSPYQRSIIHNEAEKLNLQHLSIGSGASRAVVVRKSSITQQSSAGELTQSSKE